MSAATSDNGWSDEEKAAMKEHAADLKRQKKGNVTAADNLAVQLEKIAAMAEPDRSTAQRIHDLVTKHASHLEAKTWYGMPSWARGGKSVIFFQDAAKFKARYATLGFSDIAALDDGAMWATSFAIMELTPAVEKQIIELITRAAG